MAKKCGVILQRMVRLRFSKRAAMLYQKKLAPYLLCPRNLLHTLTPKYSPHTLHMFITLTSEVGGDGHDADDGDDDCDDGDAEADAAEGAAEVLPVAPEVQLKTHRKCGHSFSGAWMDEKGILKR